MGETRNRKGLTKVEKQAGEQYQAFYVNRMARFTALNELQLLKSGPLLEN